MRRIAVIAQADEPFVRWDWIGRNLDDLWAATQEHIVLTAIAVGVGLLISLALSIVALRWRKTYTPITWVTGVLYTIPSLALFAFLVPITGLTMLTVQVIYAHNSNGHPGEFNTNSSVAQDGH